MLASLILLGYILYVVALFVPRLSYYVVRASLAVIVGVLAYMAILYLMARCTRRSRDEKADELAKTPIG
ncbi:hypothetical protein PYJP_08080 [Pyrofollis japonicus]|nr:hypothetical protein PYJP_08080 [Pyrofollis japonicus]